VLSREKLTIEGKL